MASTYATLSPDTTAQRILANANVQRVPNPRLELYIVKAFLDPEFCARLCALIDVNRRPSTIADPNGDHYFRTSETCDLDTSLPEIAGLDMQLSAWSGIDPAYGEPLQGQRYAVGQEFKGHTDYFEPDGADFTRTARSRATAPGR